MKKITLTLSEYTNGQNEKKKKRINVGRIHQYKEGGEAIILDAALCATIAAMGQKALNSGEDSIWLSIFEETPQTGNTYNHGQPYNQEVPQPAPVAAPQMGNPQPYTQQQPPSPVSNTGFQN